MPSVLPRTGASEAVIGLEVDVQLATESKRFCHCPNRFGGLPNTLTCRICATEARQFFTELPDFVMPAGIAELVVGLEDSDRSLP